MKHSQSLTHKRNVKNILIEELDLDDIKGFCNISACGCIKLNRSATSSQQKNFVFCEMSRQLVNAMLENYCRNSSETLCFILKKFFIKTPAYHFPSNGTWKACIVHVLQLSEKFLKIIIHCQYLKDKSIIFSNEFECFIAPLMWVSSEEKQQFDVTINDFIKTMKTAIGGVTI